MQPYLLLKDSLGAVRKDSANDVHGGFFITLKCYLCNERLELYSHYKIVLCKLNIIGCRTLYIGSFHTPHHDKIDNDYLEKTNPSLSRIKFNRNDHALVGGGFNCDYIHL